MSTEHSFFYAGAFAAAVLLARLAPGWTFFLASFPGLFLHELAHYLVAHVFGGSPSPMTLAPRRQPDGSWVLGSVEFTANAWNGFFVGLAPLLLVPGIVALSRWAFDEPWPTQMWAGYVAGCLAWGAWPSRTDWRLAAGSPLGIVLMLAAVLAGLSWAEAVLR